MEHHLISILVVDRDEAARVGIGAILSRYSEDASIEEARTYDELKHKLTEHAYALVVLEPSFFKQDGDQIMQMVREISPQSNLLIFTVLDELIYGVRAISFGAKGYLLKTCSLDEFSTACKRVLAGKIYVSEALAEKIASQISSKPLASPYESLTERELDVYALLVCGKRIIDIAKVLKLSQKTVSTHKTRILAKFSFRSLTDILNYAVSHGLVDACRSRVAKFNENKSCWQGELVTDHSHE